MMNNVGENRRKNVYGVWEKCKGYSLWRRLQSGAMAAGNMGGGYAFNEKSVYQYCNSQYI